MENRISHGSLARCHDEDARNKELLVICWWSDGVGCSMVQLCCDGAEDDDDDVVNGVEKVWYSSGEEERIRTSSQRPLIKKK